MSTELVLQTYKDVLKEIEQSSDEKHLLLCNGFNCSLGVYTTYENIFEKMKSFYNGYNNLDISSNYIDLEHIIGRLKEQINSESSNKLFLDDFINNKVKFDFMTSTYSIVKENIKNIYQEQSEGVGLLFKNFTNFFTLNYDPLLYLLLMKYKKSDRNLALNNTLNYKLFDIEARNPENFERAKEIRDTYVKKVEDKEQNVINRVRLSKVNKKELETEIRKVFKSEFRTFRKEYVDILYSENKNFEQEVVDGFDGELFPCEDLSISQNVFFLHGAFHIYQKNNVIRKITQTQNKALYNRLEEILGNPSEEIVCVLSNTDKINEINKNNYLTKCFNKLINLEGTLLIMGSSFDDNDKHIYDSINNSKITKIYNDLYYGESEKDVLLKDRYNKLKSLFPKKEIIIFDSKSISYDKVKIKDNEK